MKQKAKAVWGLIRETFQDWSEDKAPRLAAALAYYTIFSLAPLLVLVIAIAGFVLGNNDSIRQELLGQVQAMMGAEGAEAVNTLIQNTSQPGQGILATIIGIFTLILGATGVFGQLQDALNTIWEVEPKKGGGIMGMVKTRFLSFTMVLGISFLLLVSLVVSAGLSLVNNYFSALLGPLGFLAQVINIVISLGVITLVFAMIFKILPDATVEWKDVWIGALVTAILFTIGKQLLGIYLGSSAPASAFGAAGSLVILLLWVYYSAQILFLGAEFTQVYARHHGSRIQPSAPIRVYRAARRLSRTSSSR
jgi:membrane protein